MQRSVSKDGITWTFSRDARVGQFVNGDYYVIGPVTVTGVSPAPAGGRNGSVVNLPGCRPPNVAKTAFDSRTPGQRYDGKLAAQFPVDLAAGDSLVSSISVETMGEIKRVMEPGRSTVSPVQSVAILTCLAEPVPADTFRPSYCDVGHDRWYYSRNLRRDLLLELARVPSTPSVAQFAGYFRRPWIDTLFFGFDAPVEYMPDYGREVARVGSHAALLLMLDFPAEEKENLLVPFVQYGIDLFGAIRGGYPGWGAHGGHGSGRKLPIVFAGRMLDDPEMQRPRASFGEDLQTRIATQAPYGPGWTGASALFAGHAGINGEAVKPGWGPYEHLQPRDWVSSIGEDYRRCCTSVSWVGETLAARLIGAEEVWNHAAFFAYVDRWMTEDDTAHVAEIQRQIGVSYGGGYRQRQAWDRFVEEMWAAYGTVQPDTVAPTVSDASATWISSRAALLSWSTDEPASSVVAYGATAAYGSTEHDGAFVVSHAIQLTGLTPDTVYHFQIRSTDRAGNASSSGDSTFRTTLPDTVAPTVALDAPAAGVVVSGSVMIIASATDNAGGSGVESVNIFVDGQLIGTRSAPTYSGEWDSLSVPDGLHAISAKAIDGEGNESASPAVSVEVRNSQTLTRELMVYLAFGKQQDAITPDASGNGNDAVLFNGAGRLAGLFSQCLALDGIDDYVRVERSLTLDCATNAVSVCAWVRLEPNGRWQALTRKILEEATHVYPYAAYDLIIEDAGDGPKPRMAVSRADGSRGLAYGSAPLEYGTWHHIAGIYDGATIRIYVNGTQSGSAAFSGGIVQNSQALLIGCNSIGGDVFKGLVDEFRVYGRALSGAEVQALCRVRPPVPPLGVHAVPQ